MNQSRAERKTAQHGPQDTPGKVYQIRKLDGSEAWQQWYEVSEAEYYAPVSNKGWGRRILCTAQGATDA